MTRFPRVGLKEGLLIGLQKNVCNVGDCRLWFEFRIMAGSPAGEGDCFWRVAIRVGRGWRRKGVGGGWREFEACDAGPAMLFNSPLF